MLIKKDALILFQGDSITDAGRNRDLDTLGVGYAHLVGSIFQASYPELQVKFLNRGISGNRVRDLKNRWEKDCLELKPDVLSILIGVNDCWRRFDRNDPTSSEDFKRDYVDILEQTKKALPKTKIILLEPFLLPVRPQYNLWREDLDPKIHVVRELAGEYKTEYLALDGHFAEAITRAEPTYWAYDGVHPTNAGHGLIAKKWLELVTAKQ